MNASRNKGTRAETAVVRWARANGFPDADRAPLRGTADTGDITGIPSHVISVKWRAGNQPMAWPLWLRDLERMQDNGTRDWCDGVTSRPSGLVICNRAGIADVGRWYAVTTVADYFDLFGELLT